MNPPVVLIHGLRHTPLSMFRLARRLRSSGREVLNLGYPSGGGPIDVLAEFARQRIAARFPSSGPVDFVTHSMGGILLRQMAHTQPDLVHRAVMLAPPNRGSELVDRLSRFAPARWVMGPAGQQLGVSTGSVPNRLGPVEFCLGVIAGSRPDNPFSRLFIPGPEDGRVSVENTIVDGMTAQLVVPHGHFYLMQIDEVIRQAMNFLDNGCFRPGTEPT